MPNMPGSKHNNTEQVKENSARISRREHRTNRQNGIATVIKQIAYTKSDREYSREVVAYLPIDLKPIADQIGVCFEISKDLIIFYTQNSEHTRIARLSIPGFEMGERDYPEPIDACIAMLQEVKNETGI